MKTLSNLSVLYTKPTTSSPFLYFVTNPSSDSIFHFGDEHHSFQRRLRRRRLRAVTETFPSLFHYVYLVSLWFLCLCLVVKKLVAMDMLAFKWHLFCYEITRTTQNRTKSLQSVQHHLLTFLFLLSGQIYFIQKNNNNMKLFMFLHRKSAMILRRDLP
jgi:hypothetical protein